MSTDLEERLRQRMEQATAEIQMPRGLARRAAGHRQRRIAIRAGAAAATAAAVAAAAGIVVAALPSAPVVLTAKLLADRASAAALTQPAVSPGQWVYRVVEWKTPHAPNGVPDTGTEAGWETADGGVTYGDNYSVGVDVGDNIPSYAELGSLPTDPAALDAYLARLVYPDSNPTKVQQGLAAFSVIEDMLINYVLPPQLEAEIYQALAVIPAIKVDSHVTAIDGQAGVAFVLPPTPQSEKLEIILDASSYRFLARASWDNDSSFSETAVVRMVIVGAPGSTQPSLTPPTPAELLAEQADRAVTFTNALPLFAQPGTWILRELATSSGDQTVWATADDSEQASYVNGKLQVCSRSAACATSTQWLMPAGPSYALVNSPHPAGPAARHAPPAKPARFPSAAARDAQQLPHGMCRRGGRLQRRQRDGQYDRRLRQPRRAAGQLVPDARRDTRSHGPAGDRRHRSGRRRVPLPVHRRHHGDPPQRSTYRFVGYVRDGIQTVVTKEVTVSGPGSLTPVVVRPKPALMPPARH